MLTDHWTEKLFMIAFFVSLATAAIAGGLMVVVSAGVCTQ